MSFSQPVRATESDTGRRVTRFLVRIALLAALVGIVLWYLTPGHMAPTIEPGTTLVLEISGDYVEAPAAPVLARLTGRAEQPFAGLLSTLAMAQRDSRIAGVVLVMRGSGLGWGKAQEVRDAIADLRRAGKHTTAYLELASFSASRDYYVATAADEIAMPPGAVVPVVGLAAEYLFLGGVWEKIGVQIESERIGRFKSAVESYTGTQMSEAHREMANSLLDSIDGQFVQGIAEGRGLTVEKVRETIDWGPILATELKDAGLIDRIAHLGELEPMQGPTVKAADYATIDPSSVGFSPVARFALIYGAGTVVSGDSPRAPGGGPSFASDTVSQALADAADDPDVGAIILRIDSPGGSSLASEVIWQAVRDARAKGKPVIASFSDVAASGGYYAAVGADKIVCDPGALTGSIGVFVLRPIVGGLLDKVGIGVESLTRGKMADFLLSTEPLSPAARERLRAMVVDTYDLFVKRVAEGRGLEIAAVDAVGQGRVWTGAQAVEEGLVDELGGLRAAVAAGRQALSLKEDADVELVLFPPPQTLASQLAELIRGGGASVVAEYLPEPLRRLEAWLLSMPARTPLLIPPVLLDIR